jgi:phospholipid/cholesterol/gamma-HCH transport system substrate-binding protein
MIDKRKVLVGLIALVITVAFSIYVVGGLAGRVSNDFPVTATFDHVGQLLRPTGDVKLRGVLVGKIERIDHIEGGKAKVRLALDPQYKIPADVSASIRGKTLFGEKFVALVDPEKPSGAYLKPGDEIPESRTVPAFELEQVLESIVPVLDATKPGDLGGALHALAVGLAGNEEVAQKTIDNSLILLGIIGANKGSLDRLFAGFDEGSAALARAAPTLAAAATDLDTLSRAIVENRSNLESVIRDVPRWLDVVAQLVQARYRDLVDLSVKGATILDLVASHRKALPSTVKNLKEFTQAWDTNLSTPCEDVAGNTVAEKHPELAGSTCWQVWILSAEKNKASGGYGPEGPQPGPAAVAAAFDIQLRQLLGLPFGTVPTGLQTLIYGPIRDARGFIPGDLL